MDCWMDVQEEEVYAKIIVYGRKEGWDSGTGWVIRVRGGA